jgi:pimeloyl-ACP methyl ester carboxylesterase
LYDRRVRVLLIHGSVGNAETWAPVLPALEQRYEVVAPNRGGYPPGALLERIDFERQAEELAPLLAAAHPERVRSLAVSEPPAFGLARGNPAVDDLLGRIEDHFAHGPREPRAFAEGFLALVGSETRLPERLSPGLEQGIRATMVERLPSEAQIPLDELAETTFPKLVISGAHHPAFDAVCDVLETSLGAERAVLPGAGHSLARAPGYPERLRAFLDDSGGTEQSAR